MREFQETTSRRGIPSNTSRAASSLPARRCHPISLFAEAIASHAPDIRATTGGPARRDAARATPSGGIAAACSKHAKLVQLLLLLPREEPGPGKTPASVVCTRQAAALPLQWAESSMPFSLLHISY